MKRLALIFALLPISAMAELPTTWWSFDDWPRTARTGPTGIVVGAVSSSAGIVGTAASFAGSGNYYAWYNWHDTGSNLTAAAWINPAATNRMGCMNNRSAGASDGWAMGINRQQPGTFYFYHAGGTVCQTASGLVPLNRWTHVAVTEDKSTLLVTLYINGSKVTSTNMSASWGAYVGTGSVGGDDAASLFPFTGLIDDVRIYQRVWSPTEIRQLVYPSIPMEHFQ